ncbi:tetratricopeptide repeat protein [Acanthopleuribacter pedis]|uniref:Tetratricopeptide repeat protein n=1 Tax=Acanthopleuribacter pedis TaxID=442870 RepID=A0A8J7QMS8_9BACT|nr:tetratricopeptide repeat protein [Acanthopleuribacter pedis]MBO1322205.1 tetratricopeptide repeat protein [Acanthopleuribacter pedis]
MERVIADFNRDLETFVEQRHKFLMLIPCSDGETVPVLKMLRGIEEADASDVFLSFADECNHIDAYISVCMERLREEWTLANTYAGENDKDPLPELPPELFDGALPAAERLIRAFDYLRAQLPPNGGHRLVWVMCPTAIGDRGGLINLLNQIVPADKTVQPWMRQVRLIVRDVRYDLTNRRPGLCDYPRVWERPIDLSQKQMVEALDMDAKDPTKSDGERIQALLSLAIMDTGYNRTKDALFKLDYCMGYYQSVDDKPMIALVYNCMGDTYRRQNNWIEARDHYEWGVVTAADCKNNTQLYHSVRSLGDTHFKLKEYGVSEQYYDQTDQMATHLLDPDGKVDAMMWRGLSQEKQEKWQAACASFEGAATLSRNLDMNDKLQTNLGHLKRVYPRAGREDQVDGLKEELKNLKKG